MRKIDQLQQLSKCFKSVSKNKESVKAWLELAQTKVQDAENKSISFTTRVEACYDAIFNLAQCILMAKGFRVSSEQGHHRYALEAACSEIGASETLWDMVDAVREIRNDKYAGLQSTEEDYLDASNAAREFIKSSLRWMEIHHPQLLR